DLGQRAPHVLLGAPASFHLLLHLLVEPGILQGDGGLGGEDPDDLQPIGRERRGGQVVLEIEQPAHAPLWRIGTQRIDRGRVRPTYGSPANRSSAVASSRTTLSPVLRT